MDFYTFDCGMVPASVNISRFQGRSGVDEYHLSVRPTDCGSIDTHLDWVFRAYRDALLDWILRVRFSDDSSAAICRNSHLRSKPVPFQIPTMLTNPVPCRGSVNLLFRPQR